MLLGNVDSYIYTIVVSLVVSDHRCEYVFPQFLYLSLLGCSISLVFLISDLYKWIALISYKDISIYIQDVFYMSSDRIIDLALPQDNPEQACEVLRQYNTLRTNLGSTF